MGAVLATVVLTTALLLLMATATPLAAQPLFETYAPAQVDADTVRTAASDDGRLATVASLPRDAWAEQFGVALPEAWFRNARRGTVRLSGAKGAACTASYVSPHGLLLTSYQCALKVGAIQPSPSAFVASGLEEEPGVTGVHAEELIAVTDVTGEIQASLDTAATAAEAAIARRAAAEVVQDRLLDATPSADRVEIVSRHGGAASVAHVYRRTANVRLVFRPERDVGRFGGIHDAFTYPRYAFDLVLLRLYTDAGAPVEPDHFFPWSRQGARPGDPVFAAGITHATHRAATHAQLAFRRDVTEAARYRFTATRAALWGAYVDSAEAPAADVKATAIALSSDRKQSLGRRTALRDAYMMIRIQKREDAFQRLLRQDADLQQTYGGVVDSLAALQDAKREYASAHRALYGLPDAPAASATLRRALAYRLAGGQEAPPAQLVRQMQAVEDQPSALDARLIIARLRDFEAAFGEQDPVVQSIPRRDWVWNQMDDIVVQSVFSDAARAAEAVRSGSVGDDPFLVLVEAFAERYRAYRSAWAGLLAREAALERRLGAARQAVYGTQVSSDAVGEVRLSGGRVQSYANNGTVAPPFTTFYGAFERAYAHGDGSAWELPPSWRNADALNRGTPLAMISTNDHGGGMPGAPLLNADLELVGVVTGGNVQSLASPFIYRPDRMRTVALDVRGIEEGLRTLYDADALVQELTRGMRPEAEPR